MASKAFQFLSEKLNRILQSDEQENMTRVKFQRLSEKQSKTLYLLGLQLNLETLKKAIARQIHENEHNIDIVDNGCIITDDARFNSLQEPYMVVVHNMDRQVPPDVRTHKKDMMNPWEEEPRSLMSCDHAITPDNLYGYCWNELTSQRCQFRCFADVNGRKCGWEWFFPEVAHSACLAPDEHVLFEMRINRNWVNKSAGVRDCPFCMAVCERQSPDNPRVRCMYCQKEKRKEYEFCWFCLLPWNENHSCSKDSARNILNNCSTKEIIGLSGCPSIRACPGCKVLIEHTDACKQMDCRQCHCKFCFICLQVADKGKYVCGQYNTKCTIAPIQKI